MTIICNLKSQYTRRDYNVIDAGYGYASVELRNPAANESSAAFEVEIDEIENVRTLEDGVTAEYPDHLRVKRYHTPDDIDLHYPGILM